MENLIYYTGAFVLLLIAFSLLIIIVVFTYIVYAEVKHRRNKVEFINRLEDHKKKENERK